MSYFNFVDTEENYNFYHDSVNVISKFSKTPSNPIEKLWKRTVVKHLKWDEMSSVKN